MKEIIESLGFVFCGEWSGESLFEGKRIKKNYERCYIRLGEQVVIDNNEEPGEEGYVLHWSGVVEDKESLKRVLEEIGYEY